MRTYCAVVIKLLASMTDCHCDSDLLDLYQGRRSIWFSATDISFFIRLSSDRERQSSKSASTQSDGLGRLIEKEVQQEAVSDRSAGSLQPTGILVK